MTSEKMEFPELGDSIFAKGEDWELNACVVRYGKEKWLPMTGYILGYRSAANRLFKSVMADKRGQDCLLYPTLFLWQHHVEITLKEILSFLRYLTRDVTDEEKNKSTHQIIFLWNETMRLLPKVISSKESLSYGNVELEAATNLIHEFSGLSLSNSQEGLRYSRTLKNGPALRRDFSGINLQVVHKTMSRLANLLECMLQWLQVEAGLQMEAEDRLEQIESEFELFWERELEDVLVGEIE